MALYYLVSPYTYNKSNLLAVLAIFSDLGDLGLMCQAKNNVNYFLCIPGGFNLPLK